MGTAYLDIDGQLLRDLLHIPFDTQLVGSTPSEREGTIRITVSSPDIPSDCRQVVAIYRTQHGVSFFDRWETVHRQAPAHA